MTKVLVLYYGMYGHTDGRHQPSENELKIARFQGMHVARIAQSSRRKAFSRHPP